MKRLFFLIILSSSLIVPALAQEVCNNGFDDDNDGFIDCFDKDCVQTSICLGGYIGNDAKCQVTPGQFPKFTMQLDWESPNEVVNHLNRISIGDLNGDGAPEVVATNVATDKIFILNGVGGSIQKSINVGYSIEREPVIGKIDPSSNCALIFTYGQEFGTNKWKIYAHDCNLNLVWSTPVGSEMPGNPYFLSLADFDGDGQVELYYKDEIVDARTGTRLVKSKNFKFMAAPVAVDMMGDNRLELVAGCLVYDVNLGSRTLDGGSLTLLAQEPSYRIRQETSSATSIADYNLDGFPDILATGSQDKSGSSDITKNTNQNTTIFFWDVHNFPSGPAKTYIDAFSTAVTVFDCAGGSPVASNTGSFYANGWRNGAGRINIGDTDGDGKMNAVYVSGKFLYILDENLNQLKRITVNEETSGYTGCTMFDFNGDGKSEIVYRDEKWIYILYGDGSTSNQQKCISRTNREYPIVADVDADGSTEICVTCASNDNLSDTLFCDQASVGNQRYSVVRAFKSASDPWVPARRLWNQHAYFNVNVNDDLTIPKQQQKHWLAFSKGSCTQGANYPLNKFLNQSPFLNSDGCPQYAAPDISYINGSLAINNPTCPDKDFTVSLKIENKGDLAVTANMPITFYKGDPRLAGAVRLNTITVNLTAFKPNDVFNITNAIVNGDGTSFALFIVLNDAGTSIPSPITLPNTNIIECNYDNYIQGVVQPKPVAITAALVKDDIKCIGSSTGDNGAVRAFVPMAGGIENTADYDFYWSNGAIAKPKPADFTGATYTGLADGVYSVYAIHKTASCSSDTTQATVGKITKDVEIVISLLHPYDNCKTPNGQLKAVVNLGEPAANYDFIWYKGNNVLGLQVGIGDVVSGLGAVTYTVLATDKTTGCTGLQTYTIDDNTVKPIVSTTQTDITCNGAVNSGSASASVNGVTTGYTFNWYKGKTVKAMADFTGANYNSLKAGSYTVVASNTTTQCDSDPVTITIGQVTAPVVTASAVAPMTSCDPAQPNGSAKADVGGITKGYLFEWHKGPNVLPPVVSTSSAPTNFSGNTIYTVVVTDSITGCSASKQVTIGSNIQTPTLILAAVGDVTNCTSPNGSITVTPSIDTPADYIFSWYDGPAVKASPDYAETTNILSGRPIGTYTVTAIHQTKHCNTGPITAKIIDATPIVNIVLADSVTKLPSDCTSPDGVMKVYVSASGNTQGFDITWYFGRAPFTSPAIQTDQGVTSSKAPGLRTGVYTVIAKNLDNGCTASSEFNLPFAHAQQLDFVSKIDDDCTSLTKGKIEVKLTKTDLPGFDESNYDIFAYSGTNDNPGGPFVEVIHGALGVTDYWTNSGLAPGDYTLVAVSNNAALPCRSVPVTAKIIKNITSPVIVPTQIDPNANCAGAPGTGDIKLDVDSGGNPNDYSFKWYEGKNISSPILGTTTTGVAAGVNGEMAKTLPAGFYTAEVVNILATSTGCASIATFQVFDNPNIVSGTVATTKRMDCLTPDGTAKVTITENSVAQPSGNYTFTWSSNPAINLDQVSGLAGGAYDVKAVNNTTKCNTDVSFTIIDSTMYSVGVDLISFTNPTKCNVTGPTNGALQISATPAGPTYAYQWFKGSSTTPGNKLMTEINPSLNPSLIAPPDTVFTVEVTNTTTHCTVADTYTLNVESVPITLTASSAPLTSCKVPDGSTFASVTSGPPFNYFYNWSFGNSVKAVADSIQPAMNFLHSKNYTVIAVDKNYPNCKSGALTVTVDSVQVFPIVSAIVNAPMTACDVVKADGIISASVGGDIVSYTFDWYAGTVASGTPFYTGDQASNLNAGSYAVIATNMVSGCQDTTTIAVLSKPKTISPPKVTVLSDVTTCDPNNPNGSLTVAPGSGNPSEYEFTWTKDDDSFFGPKYDQIIANLAKGQYTVQEKEIASGCVASAPGVVGIKQTPPQFDLAVVNASCNVFVEGGGSSGEPDGSIALFLTNDVGIQSVVWTSSTNSIIGTGPILANVDAGDYTVTVTSDLACVTSKLVHVNTDIHPFNGISRNGDGKNENFWINCIDNFPNNVVKIYNRAGTLVYEATNYNNSDIIFDGRSNRGVSPMGTNLPDGTYFYIIDKRDGSKQLAGYLEIVN